MRTNEEQTINKMSIFRHVGEGRARGENSSNGEKTILEFQTGGGWLEPRRRHQLLPLARGPVT